MPPVQFAIHSYQARALPLSAQRLVNFYAEQAPNDAKSQVVVYGTPGIKSFADLVGDGPLRGAKVMAGTLYVVSGDTLYEISSDGTATSKGTINTSSGRVSMAVNLADPQQLAIVDGQDGWIFDTTNGLQQITDADFKTADVVDFQDGYFVFNRAGTSQFFISNLNDGLTIDSTDFATVEGASDELVSLVNNHRELWLFGARTTEVWFNSGDTDFPFERISGSFMERGCAAAFSVAVDDNTVFWLGDDHIVYRAHGYTPVRISTHAIEEALRGYGTVDDAFAFFYTMGGHKFYVLTFPTEKATWVFDVATQLWHERESFGKGRWRVNAYAFAYGKHLVGDFENGRVGELDLDTFEEWGETLQSIATSPPSYGDKERLFFRRFEVDIEAGVGLTSGQGEDPQIWLDWSQDGGRTWSQRKPPRSMGKKGEYRTRLRWLRLGQSRDRVFRLTVADPVKRSILSAHMDIERGLH